MDFLPLALVHYAVPTRCLGRIYRATGVKLLVGILTNPDFILVDIHTQWFLGWITRLYPTLKSRPITLQIMPKIFPGYWLLILWDPLKQHPLANGFWKESSILSSLVFLFSFCQSMMGSMSFVILKALLEEITCTAFFVPVHAPVLIYHWPPLWII